MKGQPVAKRTRSQTDRMIVEKCKKLKENKEQGKYGAESSGSKVNESASSKDDECVKVFETDNMCNEEEPRLKRVADDCAVFFSESESDNDGSDPLRPIIVDCCREEDLDLDAENGSLGSKKSDADVINVDFMDDDGDVDDDDDDDDDDDEEEEEEEEEESETDDEGLLKACRKNKEKLNKLTKRKHNCVLKHDNVERIILNSILNMEETPSEDYSSSSREVSRDEISQSFNDDEESTPSEKSECDDGLSSLWDEMAVVLKLSEMHSTNSPIAENEAASSNDVEAAKMHCLRGDHDLILNEEYGLYCTVCSYVKSIKDIDPPFATSPSRRAEWREYNNVDPSFLDDLNRCDSGFESPSGCDPFTHAQGTVWELVPCNVRKKMFPHQHEGFEFIWKNIAGGINLDELKNSTSADGGNGCIISHAPGTGKTGLTLAFLQAYMKLHPRCRPVIIAPCSMLLTWEEEFKKWGIDIPFYNLNKPELSGKENNDAVNLMYNRKRGGGRVDLLRYVKLYSWKKGTGILGLSYRLFEKLVSGDELSGILLDLPGLFVFDEGHTPRNGDTCMFKALCRIKTRRRIILSGTPFQNNFQELENTLSLVRQEFAEVLHTVRKHGHKKNKAKHASLISSIGRGADHRDDEKLKELKEKIAPFVNVHKGTVLQESLPGLRHSVVILQPNEFQKRLYKGVEGVKSFVELNYCVSLISVHPSLFPQQFFESFDVDRAKLARLKLDPEAGIKTRFLLILLELCTNEKFLVFSQYIEPLILIMEQLRHKFNWREGQEVLYMDGKQDVKKRQSSINVLNDPSSQARIMLASTKACCEGINLVGASRVVLLDVVWNPFVERQAISRAYRLGQKRVVHVYHLITSETLEWNKLCRQARKVWWSNMVFSSSDGGGNNQTTASEPLEDTILEEMAQHYNNPSEPLINAIIPQPKESELIETFGEFLNKSS